MTNQNGAGCEVNAPAGTNRYGVDMDYFRKELKRLSASLPDRPADELARYLRTLANAAAPEAGDAGPVDLEAIAKAIGLADCYADAIHDKDTMDAAHEALRRLRASTPYTPEDKGGSNG